MKVYKFNGEYWYESSDSALLRVLKWAVWLGGYSVVAKLVREDGWRSIPRHWRNLTPVSVLGHRATFYGRRRWMEIRTRCGFLVIRFRNENQVPCAFLSPDGTPQNAHTWFGNAPRDVREMARTKSATVPVRSGN